MGLFKSKKAYCTVCGREIIGTNTKLNNGGCVCQNCIQKVGISDGFTYDVVRTLTKEEIIARFDEAARLKNIQQERKAAFNPGVKFGRHIEFDDAHKWFHVNSAQDAILTYDDILEFEVLEDGNSVLKGGLGSALIGGALFGIAGAIAGGSSKQSKATCNLLQLKITTRDPEWPLYYINYIDGREYRKDSLTYTKAFKEIQGIIAKLKIIVDAMDQPQQPIAGSAADEIKKYKELLDIGALTQEEFDAKKKQLLGL